MLFSISVLQKSSWDNFVKSILFKRFNLLNSFFTYSSQDDVYLLSRLSVFYYKSKLVISISSMLFGVSFLVLLNINAPKKALSTLLYKFILLVLFYNVNLYL